MPYQSQFVETVGGPPIAQIVPYRQGRTALWILTYGANQALFTDERGYQITGGLAIQVSFPVPFRMSRMLDGAMVDGPWYTGFGQQWTYWESWEETIMVPSVQDVVAKGEIMIPHDVVSTIMAKFKGK